MYIFNQICLSFDLLLREINQFTISACSVLSKFFTSFQISKFLYFLLHFSAFLWIIKIVFSDFN